MKNPFLHFWENLGDFKHSCNASVTQGEVCPLLIDIRILIVLYVLSGRSGKNFQKMRENPFSKKTNSYLLITMDDFQINSSN